MSTINSGDSADRRTEGSLHRDCSAPRVAVTQDLVNEIIRRAKSSHWGLGKAKCGTSLDQYAEANMDALALLLVNGWEAKYDLVSLFAAAANVIKEKAQNAERSNREKET